MNPHYRTLPPHGAVADVAAWSAAAGDEPARPPAVPAGRRSASGPAGRAARRPAQAGFTLIEIMVVVAIIAILGATVVPLIMDRPDQARVVRAKNDIGSFVGALELYKLDNFAYPSTEQGLTSLVEKPSGDPEPQNWKSGGYVKTLSKDPWGREYLYVSEGSEYQIVSLGRDGAEGGEDFDADITSDDAG